MIYYCYIYICITEAKALFFYLPQQAEQFPPRGKTIEGADQTAAPTGSSTTRKAEELITRVDVKQERVGFIPDLWVTGDALEAGLALIGRR